MVLFRSSTAILWTLWQALYFAPPTLAGVVGPRSSLFDQQQPLSDDSLFATNIGINNKDFQNNASSFEQLAENLKMNDDSFQEDIKNNGGYKVAWQARPVWYFVRYVKHNTCYPQSAITPTGEQSAAAGLGYWPNTDGGCLSPGSGGWSSPFPTYYTVSKCGDSEVRVVYNLFYPKDGWGHGGTGHPFDWERVFVTWTKNGTAWTTTDIAYSYHGSYNKYKWSEIWTTDTDDREKIPQDGVNLPMPKVFVSWGKHASFREKCGGSHGYCCCGLGDILSENLPWAQRRDDYYYVAEEGYLINAGRETALGNKLASFFWGGTSYPGIVQDTVCQK